MLMSDLASQTREIVQLFEQIEPRPWTVEAMIVEVTSEVGTLADSIMIQEGYRRTRPQQEIDLEDDIGDVLFMLFRIAHYYAIDLESAYEKVLQHTRKKLEKAIKVDHTENIQD